MNRPAIDNASATVPTRRAVLRSAGAVAATTATADPRTGPTDVTSDLVVHPIRNGVQQHARTADHVPMYVNEHVRNLTFALEDD